MAREIKDLYNVRGRYSDSLRAGRYGDRSRWGEIFRNNPDGPWGPTSLLSNGHRAVPVGKGGRGNVEYPPTSSPEFMKEWSYTSTPLLVPCGPLQGETLLKLPLPLQSYKHTAYCT